MGDDKNDNKLPDSKLTGDYKFGFSTSVEEDSVPPGLNEDTIRMISEKKGEPEFMLEWRLKAFEQWKKMREPHWGNFEYEPIDYQAIRYYSAPKMKSARRSGRNTRRRLTITRSRTWSGGCAPRSNSTPITRSCC